MTTGQRQACGKGWRQKDHDVHAREPQPLRTQLASYAANIPTGGWLMAQELSPGSDARARSRRQAQGEPTPCLPQR